MTAASARTTLTALAGAYDVQVSYTDDRGRRRRAHTDALLGVLGARGAPVASLHDVPAALQARRAELARRVIEPVVVAWNGRLPDVAVQLTQARGIARCTLETEDGESRQWDLPTHRRAATIHIPDVLPLGRHRLRVETESGEHQSWILAAPREAHRLKSAQWGVFAPVYAMAPAGACHGTYRELHTLAREMHSRGADIVATLPLMAAFLDTPFDPSPYAPASRLFWNDLYVDAAALGAMPDAEQRRLLQACARADGVDYAQAGAVQRQLLQPLADDALRTDHGDAAGFATRSDVADYARFRAVCDRQRAGWQAWPDRLRNGRIRDGDFDAADFRYHAYSQWAADRQIAAIARDSAAADLYLDMPLGVHPDSYDTWRHRTLFALGASAGAPPDVLFRGGQSWGFPPLDPDALRADGYAYLIATLRHQLRYASVLRLDHVMALYRLYWVPAGLPATDGVYVRYPDEEMFAVLTLESARHHAAIVGEDLGTVPGAVRRRLGRHALHRMFVVQYEVAGDRQPPITAPPALSVAALNTHDMPTFAGFWHGHDISDLKDLELVDEDGERAARAQRARLRESLARHLHLPVTASRPDEPVGVLDALLERIGAGPAAIALVGLEDLWLEQKPQNVPGTGPEVRPNWRRRFVYPFPDVLRRHEVSTRLERFAAARAHHTQSSQEQG